MKELIAKLAAIGCQTTTAELAAYLKATKVRAEDIASSEAIASLATGLKQASAIAQTNSGSLGSQRKDAVPDPMGAAIGGTLEEVGAFRDGLTDERDRFVESEAQQNAAIVQSAPVQVVRRTIELLEGAEHDAAFFREGGRQLARAAFFAGASVSA